MYHFLQQFLSKLFTLTPSDWIPFLILSGCVLLFVNLFK